MKAWTCNYRAFQMLRFPLDMLLLQVLPCCFLPITVRTERARKTMRRPLSVREACTCVCPVHVYKYRIISYTRAHLYAHANSGYLVGKFGSQLGAIPL